MTKKDIDALEKAGCDILFLPTVKEMYPDGLADKRQYELGYVETVLDGAYRPGHFQGVCMVVHRLLNIISADELYLGQKDYQQCMVIKKLLELNPRAKGGDSLEFGPSFCRARRRQRTKTAKLCPWDRCPLGGSQGVEWAQKATRQ